MAISEPMADEDIPIRQVQTAKLRQRNRSIMVSITEAIEAAGRGEGGSFRFDPGAYEELGMVPALGSPDEVDGRRSGNELTRNVRKEGQYDTLRLVIPPAVLDALSIDVEEIDWEHPPELTVWAGPDMLAFDLPEERTVSLERDDTEDGGE